MVPSRVLLVVVAVVTLLCFFTTHCFASRQYENNLQRASDERGSQPWACCDKCVCEGATCGCRDRMFGGCGPDCKNCVLQPWDYIPFYFCMDVVNGDCGEKCNPESKPWECCDKCVCDNKTPPTCGCADWVRNGCNYICNDCQKWNPFEGVFYYQCRDVINQHCGKQCNNENPALAQGN